MLFHLYEISVRSDEELKVALCGDERSRVVDQSTQARVYLNRHAMQPHGFGCGFKVPCAAT